MTSGSPGILKPKVTSASSPLNCRTVPSSWGRRAERARWRSDSASRASMSPSIAPRFVCRPRSMASSSESGISSAVAVPWGTLPKKGEGERLTREPAVGGAGRGVAMAPAVAPIPPGGYPGGAWAASGAAASAGRAALREKTRRRSSVRIRVGELLHMDLFSRLRQHRLEQPAEGDQGEAEEGRHAETVEVGHGAGLAVDQGRDRPLRLLGGLVGARARGHEAAGEAGEQGAAGRVAGRGVRHQVVVVDLAVAGDQRDHRGDAEARP